MEFTPAALVYAAGDARVLLHRGVHLHDQHGVHHQRATLHDRHRTTRGEHDQFLDVIDLWIHAYDHDINGDIQHCPVRSDRPEVDFISVDDIHIQTGPTDQRDPDDLPAAVVRDATRSDRDHPHGAVIPARDVKSGVVGAECQPVRVVSDRNSADDRVGRDIDHRHRRLPVIADIGG